MLDGWIQGPPSYPGVYWVIRRMREGVARPEIWRITEFRENRIYGELGSFEFVDKAIIAEHYPAEEDLLE